MKLFNILKFHLSLRQKAIIVSSIAYILIITTLIFNTISGHHKLVEDLTKKLFLNFSASYAPTLEKILTLQDTESISIYLLELQKNPEINYIALYDEYNNILNKQFNEKYSELFSQAYQERKNELPEEAVIKEIGHPHGFFHKQGHNFDVLIPLHVNHKYIGKIQIGIDTSNINQQVAKESTQDILIIVGVILTVSIITALIDHRLKKILSRFIATTKKMHEGDMTEKIDIKTGDALEILGNSFNLMAAAVKEREDIIEKHKNNLEELVVLRTGELAEERNKLKAIFDNVPSAIIMFDKQMTILMANAQYEVITKKPKADVVGKKCAKEICWWCDETFCLVKDCIKTQKIKSSVIHRTNISENEQYFEHLAIPLMQNNTIFGVLEIITDVTEKYETQNSLIRAEKLSTTGEFAAMFAHEFRNSVTSVKMILQLMKVKPDERRDESFKVALNSIVQMEHTVNELLYFSRPTEIKKSDQDLHALIKESVEFISHQLQKKSIDVMMDFDTAAANIKLDKDYIKKVFVNLLLNAIQAIENSGSVKITTNKTNLSKTVSDYASLLSENQNELQSVTIQKLELKKGVPVVIIEISDSGQGIPKNHLARIFDTFFTTKVNGTGLGLSFVKRVINAHNGIITVHSEQYKGTTFTIYLPLKEHSNHEKK